MDIQLPEVSGLEVTKWLKADEALADIPVIAVTAFAMKGDEERIRAGGCEDYVAKPISVVSFVDKVKRYLS
ncbi:MAG: response regulator, partial [Pseudomonadota bacterium]